MARLSDMTAAGRSDVLPGYVLSPPRLREWGEAEDEAARAAIQTARSLAEGLPADAQQAMLRSAYDDVAGGEYSMGMPKLDAFLRRARTSPFLLWLCLRVKHPQVCRGEEAGLVTAENEEDVSRAVLELWGFLPAAASKKKRVRTTNPPRSTGPGSSPPSASAA